jgi:tRNA(Ile)-lysidine synthase
MTTADPLAAFAAAMDRLEPFEPHPFVAAAVSGGADSMALALLAKTWLDQRGGHLLALVVDHGLRPESAHEAGLTIDRLAERGIPARLLRLTTLAPGAGLAERARDMRYQVLADACRDNGCRHLLLGHHAADQIETVAMRLLHGSHTIGLAGMSALRETHGIRLLRPLLDVMPDALRRYLAEQGVAWVEDPSNRNLLALRPRLRDLIARHMPSTATPRLRDAIAAIGLLRAAGEAETAAERARRAAIHPEGYALLSPGRISEAALSTLIQIISGAAYPPPLSQIATLAAEPRPATVAGVRILPAGRLGNGLLIVREEAAIAEPIAAYPDALWDGRFRLINPQATFVGATIGKLGTDAPRFRTRSTLPSAVLRTLPAIRLGKVVAAVPHLGYAVDQSDVPIKILFDPGMPVAGASFVPTTRP